MYHGPAEVIVRRVTELLALGCFGVMAMDGQAPPPLDDSVVSLRVRFGLADTQPATWDGKASVTGGRILNLRLWRPHPQDRVEGTASWRLASRAGVNFVKRPWEPEPVEAPAPYVKPAGLIVDVQGSGARVRFETKQGSFDVRPSELPAGEARPFLGGNTVVDRVATAGMISTPERQNDFAAIASGANGELWAAWISYADGKNHVAARRFDGASWGEEHRVSENHADIFLVKTARDSRGAMWFVWSAQVDGNWDLYGRRFNGGWSPVERLSSAPQPDIYPALAADAKGSLWLAWQGFRNGRSDIFVRRWDGAAWSGEERMSDSPANDWAPAIAADSKGGVYVAWDTYDKGNYDVLMRGWRNGRWSEAAAIAETAKFEAHVSLACDRNDRLWAAWNESGTQWGKDTGFLLYRQGTPLYRGRWIAVAVNAGGAWQEPVAEIERSLPAELAGNNDMPLLHAGDGGRMWLLFRHRRPRIADTPGDAPMHRAAWELYATRYEGGAWTPPVAIPFSQGRTDMRYGAAHTARGTFVAWPMDNRDSEEFLFQRADVYAGRLPAPAGPPVEPKLKPRQAGKIATFPLHPSEAQDLARIRGYAIETGGKTYRIYRGDTHRHTEFSMDGYNDGSLVDTYRYAIDAAELDYLMASEHNGAGGPDVDYVNWLLQQMADVLMVNNRFVPLYGYERSVVYPNGHRNVIFARRGNPTLPIPESEQKGQTGAQALYEYLKKYDGIAISHTSATTMGTDWRDNDPAVEPLVEIYQGDRVSAEYEGAPKAAYGGRLTGAPGGFRPAGFVWNAWAKGYKLGVQASSDHLSTHISYACTIAEEFTREGLVEAMKKRHSYGATDNIILDYRLQAGDREYIQGDIAKVSGGFKLWVKAIGTAPIRQIDVIRNNQFLHVRQPMELETTFTFVDADVPAGESYYYVRLIQTDDQMAWSSPIWITR
ncbi:MAG: hypothetical protein KIT09_17650 [Bryobacteraceae bacterium]|nr:hypothetical protein [Bryobacteraceae bacterium]